MSKEFKIYHFANYVGSETNGIDVVIKNLIKHQNVCVAGVRYHSEVHSLVADGKSVLFSRSIFRMISTLKNKRPSFVVLHSIFNPATWLIYFFLILFGIKYSIFPHSSLTRISQGKSRIKKIIARKLIVDRMIFDAEYVTFLNQEEKNNSLDICENYEIVSNGVDVINTSASKKAEKIFLYFGRYDVNHKGIDVLLEGILYSSEELRRRNYKFEFYGLVEKKEDFDFIINYISENKLDDIIDINGPIYDQDIKLGIMNKAKYFVLTSRYEGQPISCLEALASATPIIVTPGTNMLSVISESGAGFSTDLSSKHISDTLVRAMDVSDDEYLKLSSSARLYAINNFSWFNVATIHLRNYEKYSN